MDHEVESGTVGKTTWRLFPDNDGNDPREWDNLGRFTVARRSDYGTSDDGAIPFEDFAESEDFDGVVLWAWNHRYGIGETDRPQAANCAFYADADAIRKEYGDDGAESRKRANDALRGELATYRQWAEGDVYAYTVERDGETVESVGGWYGYAEAKAEAEATAKAVEARLSAAEADYACRC